jgi:hypothetical protein
LGWGGSTKNMEKDDKSYSPRGLRHCFVFVFLVYTTCSALLSFGPKIRTFVFLFVGLFFEAKSIIITTDEI